MSRTVQRYGWRPSPPDPRDLIADAAELATPASFDLRDTVDLPVYDQGQIGSCTANAVAAAVDYHSLVTGHERRNPSRLAIYALERIIEGQALSADTGAFGRDGFKACRTYGYLSESQWPYSDRPPRWQQDPRDSSDKPRKLAAPYKAVRRSAMDMRRVLANKQTIAFGFSVFESFESEAVANSGVMPLPAHGEKMVGGHEVLAVGYHGDHLICRNSWGKGWGQEGYFFMPWEIVLDPQMSSDFRTIYHPAR